MTTKLCTATAAGSIPNLSVKDVMNNGAQFSEMFIGGAHNLLNGSRALDWVTTKRNINLEWQGMTTAEFSAVRGQVTAGLTLYLQLGDSGSVFTGVVRAPLLYQPKFRADGTEIYDNVRMLYEET